MHPPRHRKPARMPSASPTPYGKQLPLLWPDWSAGAADALSAGAIPLGIATSDTSFTATAGVQTVNHDLATRTCQQQSRCGLRILLSSADKVAMMTTTPQTPNAFADFTNVLVLVGLPPGPVNRSLSRHAVDSSPEGIVVNVFNDVAGLPRYHEALEARGKPDA